MSGHAAHAAQSETGERSGSGLRRWLIVCATGALTVGLFGAAANADDGDPDRDGPRAAAPTTTFTDDTATGDTTGTPMPPGDLGDDDALDALALDCFGGDLLACDHLFLQSPVGSEYEAYGDTCGGRQEAGTENYCELGAV